MSATNHTANYNLPQYVGTDKPTWLGDINAAMLAIDNAIKSVTDLANAAGVDVDTLQSALTTAQGNISALQSLTSGHTGDISDLESLMTAAGVDISALETKVGAAALTTSAQTVVGGINEHDALVKQATAGRFVLPGGLKIFWGQACTANVNGYVRSVAVTFPQAFTYECAVLIGHSCGNTSLDTQVTTGYESKTTSGVTVKLMHSGGGIANYDKPWVDWVAIGI